MNKLKELRAERSFEQLRTEFLDLGVDITTRSLRRYEQGSFFPTVEMLYAFEIVFGKPAKEIWPNNWPTIGGKK
jgi:transcriptional regulator with XRE-family HTH domain